MEKQNLLQVYDQLLKDFYIWGDNKERFIGNHTQGHHTIALSIKGNKWIIRHIKNDGFTTNTSMFEHPTLVDVVNQLTHYKFLSVVEKLEECLFRKTSEFIAYCGSVVKRGEEAFGEETVKAIFSDHERFLNELSLAVDRALKPKLEVVDKKN